MSELCKFSKENNLFLFYSDFLCLVLNIWLFRIFVPFTQKFALKVSWEQWIWTLNEGTLWMEEVWHRDRFLQIHTHVWIEAMSSLSALDERD